MRSVVSCSFDFHIADKRSHWAMALARWHGKATDQRTPKQTNKSKKSTNEKYPIKNTVDDVFKLGNYQLSYGIKN